MRLPDEWKGPYWKPADVWIGVYVDHDMWRTKVYICAIPCLPIRLTWRYRP